MKKNVLLIAAGLFITLIYIGLRKNSAPFFSATEYECIQDGLFSDEYYGMINGALSVLLKDKCGAHVIIDQLQQQFSVLKTVTVFYKPSAIQIKLSAHEPICSVNNCTILTAHNELFDKNVFAQDAYADIPKVEVAQDSMAHVALSVSFLLQQLPAGIDAMYTIELMNNHCLYLVDKQQPQFTIVSSIDQKKSPQLLAQCATIKKNIDERKGFDKGVRWVADTRFAHYIVAYKA